MSKSRASKLGAHNFITLGDLINIWLSLMSKFHPLTRLYYCIYGLYGHSYFWLYLRDFRSDTWSEPFSESWKWHRSGLRWAQWKWAETPVSRRCPHKWSRPRFFQIFELWKFYFWTFFGTFEKAYLARKDIGSHEIDTAIMYCGGNTEKILGSYNTGELL